MSFQIRKSFVRLSEYNLRYFRWKPGGLWLSYWLPSKLHCQGPEKYEKHRQDTPSAISGSIVTLWSDKNTFCNIGISENNKIISLGWSIPLSLLKAYTEKKWIYLKTIFTQNLLEHFTSIYKEMARGTLEKLKL